MNETNKEVKRKKKKKYVDDGHTIYNMDVEGFRWHDKKKASTNDYIDKKEKRVIYRSAFKAYLPALILTLIGFGIAILLIYLWLK